MIVTWNHGVADVGIGGTIQLIDLSFRPTAVCAAAAVTDTLFVVGWSERSGQVIVERWTFSAALAVSQSPAGNAVASFTEPTVQRAMLIPGGPEPPTMPIRAVSFDTESEQLLALEFEAPDRVLLISIDSNAFSSLAVSGSARMQRHSNNGSFYLFEQRLPWSTGSAIDSSKYRYVVLGDSDQDGVVDTGEDILWNVFWDQNGGPADTAWEHAQSYLSAP